MPIFTIDKLNNLRVDTLGFNKESNSFIIFEYKRDKNFSVIDQGYAYLALLLNNKADFILLYNEKGKNLLRKDNVEKGPEPTSCFLLLYNINGYKFHFNSPSRILCKIR